jgi:hypothetical protein
MSIRAMRYAVATWSSSRVSPLYSFAWKLTPQRAPSRTLPLGEAKGGGYGIFDGVGGAKDEHDGYGSKTPGLPHVSQLHWSVVQLLGAGVMAHPLPAPHSAEGLPLPQ